MSRDLLLIGASLWFWGVGEGLFMIFLPLYMQELGASPVEIGGILGVVAVAMMIMQAPSGYLADRIGPRKVILGSWVIGLCATFIMTLANSLNTLVIGLVMFYLSTFAMPALNKYNTMVRGKLSVERALTITSVFFNIGAILGPLLGGYIGKTYGLQRNYYYASGLFLISTIIIFLIREHGAANPVIEPEHQTSEPLVRNKKYLVYLALIFVTLVATYLPQPLTPNYLQNEHHLTLEQIGQLGSIGSLSNALLMIFFGGMNASRGLLFGQTLVGVYVTLLWRGTGMPWFGAAYGMLGGYRLMRAMIVARARSLVRVAQAGTAFGLLETVNAVAVIITPPVAGFLYDLNPTNIYLIAIVLIAVSLLINLFLLPKATPQPVERYPKERIPSTERETNP